ncbi:hypothetical protein GCM10011386_00870 [Parapedobacter defluvii]|uniref:Alpha-L-rhamnosidase six-hairpin glycosidase domain-containing protein n=1 Tax=Parapedobacter defluvii TaxID=2045106 RepID=A0ABQ1KYY2_9SPHI|nr:hypothetical protein [Parapedobacter defluvii]GGC13054.1 hypothetical protein GCM10011386_00870 [Parapedobacter defluvii]
MYHRIKIATLLLLAISGIAASHAQIPRSSDLEESGPDQRRDLSLPGSRLVINPYNFRIPPGQKNASAYSNSPMIPLNAGYLSTRAPHRELPDINVLHLQQASPGHTFVTWQASLEDPSIWEPSDGISVQVSEQGLEAHISKQTRQDVQSLRFKEPITADLDDSRYLEIVIPQASSLWAVKLHRVGDASDRTIRQENTGTGTYCFDIPAETGWKGRQSFELTIYLIGRGTDMVMSHLSLRGIKKKSLFMADEFHTQWEPHQLSFQGSYADGTSIAGFDFLYDNETLVRSFRVTKPGKSPIVTSGKYNGALVKINRSTLLIQSGHYNYVVSFKLPSAGEITFYRNYTDLVAGQNPLISPPETGYWSVSGIFDSSPDTNILISYSFADPYLPTDSLIKRAQQPTANPSIVGKQLQKRRLFWDDLLKSVPHPSHFDIHEVESKGVEPADIRKAYYKAWVFLAMNVLSSDPTNFPYPQIVTGKPSLWAEGHSDAPFSAAWESFIGMQLYAYIDPEVSWAAFSGLMSLVDDTGVLGGESLPSRKAQTALLLYRLTGDKDKLAQNYPALKRYMNWRLRYPMWVYKEVSLLSETQKDADFVVSALIDLQALDTIASILALPADQTMWTAKRQQFFNHYLSWFWEQPDAIPVQLYDTETKRRAAGHAIWVTSGLAIDVLTYPQLTGMMKLFNEQFDPGENFAGFPMPKYPEMAFTARGLLARGHRAQARQLMECGVRDIVRSGPIFAEQYVPGFPPYGDGVRPSIFGMAQLIDFVLLLGGKDYLSPVSLRTDRVK